MAFITNAVFFIKNIGTVLAFGTGVLTEDVTLSEKQSDRPNDSQEAFTSKNTLQDSNLR